MMTEYWMKLMYSVQNGIMIKIYLAKAKASSPRTAGPSLRYTHQVASFQEKGQENNTVSALFDNSSRKGDSVSPCNHIAGTAQKPQEKRLPIPQTEDVKHSNSKEFLCAVRDKNQCSSFNVVLLAFQTYTSTPLGTAN